MIFGLGMLETKLGLILTKIIECSTDGSLFIIERSFDVNPKTTGATWNQIDLPVVFLKIYLREKW